jgi:hypothetical protein
MKGVLLFAGMILIFIISFLLTLSLFKVAKDSDERSKRKLYEQMDCTSCALFGTDRCTIKAVTLMRAKDCPDFVPVIPIG